MNRIAPLVVSTLALALIALPLAAQQQDKPAMPPEMKAMMEAWEKASTPGPQHRQLAEHFAGTWTTKQTMWMDPSAPPMTETGKAVSTAIMGGRHIRMEFTSQWMGQPFEGVALTSYDNVRGKYVGHWIDSMSTGQFMAEGEYDAKTRSYTFTGSMPDPMHPGKTTPVREVIRIVDADRHVMEWYETHDGKERKSMEIEYTRAR
ncbi:MAG TPA: DUF1579 domain-containing protein [Lysobacter sp.]|nr:DUF1579 domain-containing protein [Lysobacter sp.]